MRVTMFLGFYYYYFFLKKNCDKKLNGDSLNSMQAAWLSVKMRMV